MVGRFLARLVALGAGSTVGLAVVLAVALLTGLWRPQPSDAGPAQQPTPTAAVVVATPALPTPVRPDPAPPTPTSIPQAARVNSLAEAASRATELRGQLVQVVVGEQELTDLSAQYLRTQGIPAGDVRVRLRPGQVALTGNLQQSFIGVPFTVTGHPVVDRGALKLSVDSVAPALISQFSSVAPGQTIDLPMSFQAQSATVVEGQMVVTGVVQ